MPEKKKKNGRQNYDWAKIKRDYVTDPLSSQNKIAKKYGISLVTVAKRSKADDWFATKKEYQRKVTEKLIERVSAKKADELADAIISASNIAKSIRMKTEDPDQFCRYIVQEGTADSYGSSEYVFGKMDMRAAKDAVSALEGVEKLLRGYYNIQKAEALHKQQIERERLELEKERLALERERNALRSQSMGMDDESKYGVVLIPEVIDNE